MKAHRNGCMFQDCYRGQALGVHQRCGGFDLQYFSEAKYQRGHGLAKAIHKEGIANHWTDAAWH